MTSIDDRKDVRDLGGPVAAIARMVARHDPGPEQRHFYISPALYEAALAELALENMGHIRSLTHHLLRVLPRQHLRGLRCTSD